MKHNLLLTAIIFFFLLFIGKGYSQNEGMTQFQQREIVEKLLCDEEAFCTYKSFILIQNYKGTYQLERDSLDCLTRDYYIVSFNRGDPLCRFFPYDILLNSAEKCLQEILRQTAPWNLYSKLEDPEIRKTIQNCYHSLIQDVCNFETFDNEAILMYVEVGSIEVCYYTDGWEGWEEPAEFVSRFKRVKDKLLQDANMRTQLYNFLREGRKTQWKDLPTSREALQRYYERQQGSWLYSFYEFEALYQACRQYYARKNEKMLRWKQKEGYNLPKTKGEWYDQVITHYRYYKHADTQQRQQLQENFERYLAQ